MGVVLGTLLACCCLGGLLLWCLPAFFSLGGDLEVLFLGLSPVVSLGYGLLAGLEAMRTNRCGGMVPALIIPFHISWVIQQIALRGSGSD